MCKLGSKRPASGLQRVLHWLCLCSLNSGQQAKASAFQALKLKGVLRPEKPMLMWPLFFLNSKTTRFAMRIYINTVNEMHAGCASNWQKQ